ncbi:hypothetical protein JKF63_01421 [Porcisia hertigi]|uniref:Transmembrane protein n=1 Tax=Porcisia hertigi TaxID=2761500 RepID=A0A836HGH6_9TRYP|nr:hypothetical protein JKF63_01421 [Porcisia hertigi]
MSSRVAATASPAAEAAPSASFSYPQPTDIPAATPSASSSPTTTVSISEEEDVTKNSATDVVATAPRATRLLKDVEAEENRYIYETLYMSLDDATDTAVRNEITVEDTVRLARDAKKKFIKATTLPLGEKAKSCSDLMRIFSHRENHQVVYTFCIFSVLMITVPVFILLIGMTLIAPWLDVDATLCGGGLAVFSVMLLMMSYVVFAMVEDAQRGNPVADETETKKGR